MKVSELLAEGPQFYAYPVQVEGYLMLSHRLTYVVDSEEVAHSSAPHFGMILERTEIARLEAADLSPFVGTPVLHRGKISLKGTVMPSYLPILPLIMRHVYDFTFQQDGDDEVHRFVISDVYRDVYLLRPSTVTPALLKGLRPYFPEGLTFFQIKEHLLGSKELLFAEHVTGDAFTRAVATLVALGLEHRVEECPIDRFGMP